MVEVSVINAGKLKTAILDSDSEQYRRFFRWKGENLYRRLGIEDGNEVASKLSGQDITIGEQHFNINYLSFIYRRKGLNYVERMTMLRGSMIKRTKQVSSYWNRIVKWVLNGEIKESSDIVIYRSLRRTMRRQIGLRNRLIGNSRTIDKYPLRLVDDTYAIYTGQTFWLQVIASEMRRGNIATQHSRDALASIELRDNPPTEYDVDNHNPATEEMFGINRYCEAFEEWYSNSVYQYDSKHFDINDNKLRTRAYWLWTYFLTYGYDIRTMVESILGEDNSYRGSLLLWKDGVCKFWEEIYENSDFPPDRIALCNEIPNNLIGTDYAWTDSDCLFKER